MAAPSRPRPCGRFFQDDRISSSVYRPYAQTIDTASWVDPRAGRALFSAVAAAWEAGRLGKRPSTRARDHSLLNSLILPHLGDIPVAHITPSTLEQWIAAPEADGKAPATIRKAWQISSGVLRLAVLDRLIAASPAHDVELPTVKREEPKFLSAEEILRLAHAIDERWRAMPLLAGFAGLRFGEVAGLQIADVDLLHRRLTVRRTVSDVRGRLSVGRPKTERSLRSAMLPSILVDELETQLRRLDGHDAGAWSFPDADGGPIRRTNWIRRVWGPGVEAARLTPLRFHDLRHSHAAILIAQGEHPRAIADRLGHTSVTTVLDVYGHLLPGTDERIAVRLDEQIASYSRPERVPDNVRDLAK